MQTHSSKTTTRDNALTWAAVMLLAPPAYFVLAAVLDAYLGVSLLFAPIATLAQSAAGTAFLNNVLPFLMLGALGLSLLLLVLPVLRLNVTHTDDGVSVTFHVKTRWLNLTLLGVGTLTVAIMLAYAVVENLVVR